MNPELSKLLQEIKALTYGRNSVRSNYLLVPKELKGTCSTKHAYVKHIASQKGWENVKLFTGIYIMKESNTTGVGAVLKKYALTEIPEAHTYLKIDSEIIDITGLETSEEPFEKTLQLEQEITPDEIGSFKLEFHKAFISEWSNSTKLSTEEVWKIREECIQELSKST